MFSQKLTKHIKNILDDYFLTLEKTGYTPERIPDKIAVLIGIDEFIDSPMGIYIADKDFRIIQQALACILGSECLIPHLEGDRYVIGQDMPRETTLLRISEDGILRFTEDGSFRITD